MPDALPPRDSAVPQAVWLWLARLHALTAGSSSAEEAEARINLVAGMIAQRFGRECFTQRSLEHVAAASKFWPSYGELVERLGQWRRLYLPSLSVAWTPEPDRPAPTAEELVHVSECIRQVRAIAADIARKREAHERPLPALPDVSLQAMLRRRGMDDVEAAAAIQARRAGVA